MSQPESSDTHFFNSFSVVLGILIAFAIVLFAVARVIGRDVQEQEVLQDPLHYKAVQQNIAPFAHVAIAGQDNSALAALSAPKARCCGGGGSDHRGAGIQASLLGLSWIGYQWRAQGRRSCGMGTAHRARQGCAVRACHRRQGSHAPAGRHELARCHDSHGRRLHGLAQQVARSNARKVTASATSWRRMCGSAARSAHVRASLSTR